MAPACGVCCPNGGKPAYLALRKLRIELARFKLRLNPIKTRIVHLPQEAEEEWQQILIETGGRYIGNARDMVKHFEPNR